MSQEILWKAVMGWLLISVIVGILRDIYLTHQRGSNLSDYFFSLISGGFYGFMCGAYIALVGAFFWHAVQTLFYQ